MRGIPRWLAWTGPLLTIVFAISVFMLEGSTPGEKASTAKIQHYYGTHQGRVTASALLSPLGALLIVLFASYVRSLARERTGGNGVGPTVLISGAVLWAAGALVGSIVDLSLVTVAHRHYDELAKTFNVLSNSDWLPFIGGLAVMLVGAGMTVLSSRILPQWLGWVALVAGVASLFGPGGFLGFFVGPLWFLVAGIMLGVRKEPAPVTT